MSKSGILDTLKFLKYSVVWCWFLGQPATSLSNAPFLKKFTCSGQHNNLRRVYYMFMRQVYCMNRHTIILL
jgi:hypothetical protein